jgi:hypothetical protein
MPQCEFPVFCCFCVSKKLHRKYSRNWTKQKPNIKKFTEAFREPKRRRNRARGWSHHQGARPRAWPRRPMVSPTWSTYNAAPSPIKTPWREKPKYPDHFSRNTSRSTVVVDLRSGGSRSSSRHPTREGNCHRRSSSSPCLPPVRCVSSLPWTMGP